MKKLIYSSLLAVLLLGFSLHEKAFAQDKKLYNFAKLSDPPSYPGGLTEFYRFLSTELKYPKDAIKEGIQGTINVSFTIEKDGSLADVKTVQNLGGGIDEETVRVIKLSKKWNPGLLDGKPVNVRYVLPVKFKLPEKAKKQL